MGICSTKGNKIYKQSALLIIDAQNDFLKGGTLAVQGSENIVSEIKNIKTKIDFDCVVFTRDWHPSDHVSFACNNEEENRELFKKIKLTDGRNQLIWPTHCVQDTPGAEFPAILDFKESDLLISKGANTVVDSESAFGTYPEVTDLEKMLTTKSIARVFLTGFPLEYTVFNTAMDSLSKGLDTFIVEDLVGCLKEDKKQGIIDTLRTRGVKFLIQRSSNFTSLNRYI